MATAPHHDRSYGIVLAGSVLGAAMGGVVADRLALSLQLAGDLTADHPLDGLFGNMVLAIGVLLVAAAFVAVGILVGTAAGAFLALRLTRRRRAAVTLAWILALDAALVPVALLLVTWGDAAGASAFVIWSVVILVVPVIPVVARRLALAGS